MNGGAPILLLNRNRENLRLLTVFQERPGFNTIRASSLSEMDDVLDRAVDLRLALLDLTGFDARLWERCERLRKMDVPFLLIFPTGKDVERHGIARGANGILQKPVVKEQLYALVSNLLR